MQNNLYFREPDMVRIETRILATSTRPNGHMALATIDNIVRAAGGGEPTDLAKVTIDGAERNVAEVFKEGGMTWLTIDGPGPVADQPVTVSVDEGHRLRRRRLHTAVHVAIRSCANVTSLFNVLDADIGDDARAANIVADAAGSDGWFDDAAATFAALNEQGRTVSARNLRSIEHAKDEFGGLFRLSDRYQLSGKVRVVHIDGFDANPCAGLHAPDTRLGDVSLVLGSCDATGRVQLFIDIPT